MIKWNQVIYSLLPSLAMAKKYHLFMNSARTDSYHTFPAKDHEVRYSVLDVDGCVGGMRERLLQSAHCVTISLDLFG